jgi:hypothetical protein
LSTTREVRCTNPDCGSLNRVPNYSIRRLPECGKCHTKLPETRAVKILRGFYAHRHRAIVALGVVALLGWSLWSIPTSIVGKQDAPKTQPILPVTCVERVLPPHGLYAELDFSERPAELTIQAAPGSSYFVNLENAATQEPALLFFVYGGHSLIAPVPLGSYKIKYAAGSTWCGGGDLFGSDTIVSEAEDILTFDRAFTADGYSATRRTVELSPQRGGSLRTKGITRDQFYGRAALR